MRFWGFGFGFFNFFLGSINFIVLGFEELRIRVLEILGLFIFFKKLSVLFFFFG